MALVLVRECLAINRDYTHWQILRACGFRDGVRADSHGTGGDRSLSRMRPAVNRQLESSSRRRSAFKPLLRAWRETWCRNEWTSVYLPLDQPTLLRSNDLLGQASRRRQ